MKKLIICALIALFLAGCAGRSANPIATREVGDNKMECEEILAEMSELDRKARRLMGEQSAKTGKNVAWGVAGLFIWPLWLAMDLSDAERQEAVAMQDRYSHLQRIHAKKDCEDF